MTALDVPQRNTYNAGMRIAGRYFLGLISVVLAFAGLSASGASPSSAPQMVLQIGHSGAVSAVAVSPDGKIVASGSWDGAVRLWNRASGELMRVLTGSGGFVESLAFSPDGETLAVGANSLGLWDTRTGRVRHAPSGNLKLGLPPDRGYVKCVAFSPDGKLAATGDSAGYVTLYDGRSGALLRVWPRPAKHGAIWSIAYSPDGKTLACSPGSDGVAELWDVATGQIRQTLKPPDTSAGYLHIAAISFAPDGKTLAVSDTRTVPGVAAGTMVGEIQIWDIKSAHLTRVISSLSSDLTALAFSPDGMTLVGAAEGTPKSQVQVWDAATGAVRQILATDDASDERGGVLGIAFAQDSRTLAVGYVNGDIRLWNLEKATPEQSWFGYGIGTLHINSLFLIPGTLDFGMAGGNGTVCFWDGKTGAIRDHYHITGFSLPGEARDYVSSVALSRDGSVIAAVGYGEDLHGVLRIFDMQSGDEDIVEEKSLESGERLGLEDNSIDFSPDGKTLAVALYGRVRLRDWKAHTWLPKEYSGRSPVKYSPDGALLVLGEAPDRTLGIVETTTPVVWNLITGGYTKLDSGRGSDKVSLSPDSSEIASIGKIWNAKTGALKRTMAQDGGDLVFSPDGKSLAGLDAQGALCLWDAATGRQRFAVPGCQGPVIFSHDGRTLIGISKEGFVHLWNTQNGKLRLTLTALPDPPNGTPDSWIAFTPDGHYDGSADAAKFIRWRVGDKLFPAAAYAKQFHRPDLVQKALQGGS